MSQKLKLELSVWTHHLTHLLYSFFYYCEENRLDFEILYNNDVKHNAAVLTVDNKNVFFDYSDDTMFIDNPKAYDFYFKRSLLEFEKKDNIFPLNFNVPMAYKSYSLLLKFQKDFLFNKSNRKEVLRALDIFDLFANSSHNIIDIRKYPNKVLDHGGRVIYYTRLWNPANHPDEEEKERRRLQNEFRINACRVLKKEYKNAFVGLFGDNLSSKLAPDLVLPSNLSNKKKYLAQLSEISIGIADDGLKDTPGWKIGEYLLHGKAVITTPLNIVVDNFTEGTNYEKLFSRSNYDELPSKIEYLIKDKKYLEMGITNKEWSDNYIHPKNYLKRILAII